MHYAVFSDIMHAIGFASQTALQQPALTLPVMATQIHTVVSTLRRRILQGDFVPGDRLVELQLAAELGVSRTPIRLAFETLAKEGLVERLPTRGFRVRAFTVNDLTHAIDVRGNLEGMAARLVAEQGLPAEALATLKACVEEGEALLHKARQNHFRIEAKAWVTMNARFHATLVAHANNPVLASALEHVSKIPMASAAALSLDGDLPELEFTFIERAQQDHADVLDALMAREGARAESLMREHARRSRDNKRQLWTGRR